MTGYCARFTHLILLLLLSSLFPDTLLARIQPPYLQHAIGDTIDAEEAEHYQMFTNVFGFQQAVMAKSEYTSRNRLIIRTFDGIETRDQEILLDDNLLEIFALLLARADSIAAGDSVSAGVPVDLVPKYGSSVHGFATRWTGHNLIIDARYGVNTVPLDEIVDVDIFHGTVKKDTAWGIRDPNRTRLFFMPTGRSLKKGEGYFAVYEAVMPGVQVGFGHNISLGGGIFPWSLPYTLIGWFTGQVGLVDKDNYSFAVGNLTTLVGVNDSENAGIFYGVGSVGSATASATLGLGFGFVDGFKLADDPFIVIGAELQTGRSTKLITENWMIPGTDWPVTSIGLRWYGSRISADFAVIRPLTDDFNILGIPWVDFVIHF